MKSHAGVRDDALVLAINRFARGVFVLSAGAYVGVHGVAHSHPAPGWNWIINGALVLSVAVILLTTAWIRDRRPTVRVGARGGAYGIWVERPVQPLGWKRQLRRRTMDLVLDIHKTQGWRSNFSHPDDLDAVNKAMREAKAASADIDAWWNEEGAPTLNRMSDARRAEAMSLLARRVSEVAGEYVERGRLDPDEAERLTNEFRPASTSGAAGLRIVSSADVSAAERLEQLAKELRAT